MKNPFELFRRTPEMKEPPATSGSLTSAIDVVRAYHAATRHDLFRYARGPGELDWATQPDPFRRYHGAALIALDHVPLSDGPLYREVWGEGRIPAARVDRSSISRLFLDALALSAWKQYGESRWALRVNPSSGNLHPTESYFVCGPIEDLCTVPMLAHYAPREHALEVRGEISREVWIELSASLPAGAFFVGLSSIHWREAWKYGERAYRYCQHDAGHAIACLNIAAAGLGWRVALVDDLSHEDLGTLFGLRALGGIEGEEPDCLLAVIPDSTATFASRRSIPSALGEVHLAGEANQLSPDHVHWGAIDSVAEVCRKPRTQDVYKDEPAPAHVAAPPSLRNDATLLRPILHQRRSAVAFDGRTEIERESFYRMLAQTVRGPGVCLPWAPRVHLALFVHRVGGLDPGLYLLARDPSQKPLLQAAMKKPFAWETPAGCPADLALSFLARGDCRALARSVSCHQEIAADGCFALSMLAEFEPALQRYGAWFYPRLYWECGVVGQVLYLEAEACGIRATGIGCFFDEPAHQVFGLDSPRYRSLYHFTVGGPVEDQRLTTWPAYPARDAGIPGAERDAP